MPASEEIPGDTSFMIACVGRLGIALRLPVCVNLGYPSYPFLQFSSRFVTGFACVRRTALTGLLESCSTLQIRLGFGDGQACITLRV
jgi:hypothetical protein